MSREVVLWSQRGNRWADTLVLMTHVWQQQCLWRGVREWSHGGRLESWRQWLLWCVKSKADTTCHWIYCHLLHISFPSSQNEAQDIRTVSTVYNLYLIKMQNTTFWTPKKTTGMSHLLT